MSTFPLILTNDPPPSSLKRPIYRDALNGTERLGLKKLTLKTLLSLCSCWVSAKAWDTHSFQNVVFLAALCVYQCWGAISVYFHFVFKAQRRDISVNNHLWSVPFSGERFVCAHARERKQRSCRESVWWLDEERKRRRSGICGGGSVRVWGGR